MTEHPNVLFPTIYFAILVSLVPTYLYIIFSYKQTNLLPDEIPNQTDENEEPVESQDSMIEEEPVFSEDDSDDEDYIFCSENESEDEDWSPKRMRRNYNRDVSILRDNQLIRHVYKYDIWYAKYDKKKNIFETTNQTFTSPSGFAEAHATMINKKKTRVNGWEKCECWYKNKWMTLHEYWKLSQ